MTLLSTPPPMARATATPGIPPFPISRFTVEQYHRMIETGVFDPDEELELIDGYLTPKMSRNPPHDFIVTRMSQVLAARVRPPWLVRPQCAVTLARSEPEPDFSVVAGPDERYVTRHPGPADLQLVIEVAHSSLALDREVKGAVYAADAVPHYWVLNVAHPQVEAYGEPTGQDPDPEYRSRRIYRAGESVPLILGGQQADLIPVDEIFPPNFPNL